MKNRMNVFTAKIRWVLTARDSTSATLQTLLSKILILGITVVTGVITARYLGPAGRGEQAAILLWGGFLGGFVTLGLPPAVIYNFKQYPTEKSRLFAAALLLSLGLGMAATVIGILWLPQWLGQYSPSVIRFAQVFMLLIPLLTTANILNASLEALGEFTLVNHIRYLSPLFTLGALIIAVVTRHLTPFTAALAYGLPSIPASIWMLSYLWPRLQPSVREFKKSSQQLLHYGVRSYGIDLLGTLSNQIDQIIVVGLLQPASLGTYVVALSSSRLINIFQSSVVTVLFPRIAARPLDEIVTVVGQVVRVCTIVTGLSGICLVILGPVLFQWLYGAEFLDAIPVFYVLVLEIIISGVVWILAQAFMAARHPGIVTLLQSIGLGFNIPLMLILIPKFGLLGVGFSLLISTSLRLFFILISFPLILKTRPPNMWLRHTDLLLIKRLFQGVS